MGGLFVLSVGSRESTAECLVGDEVGQTPRTSVSRIPWYPEGVLLSTTTALGLDIWPGPLTFSVLPPFCPPRNE